MQEVPPPPVQPIFFYNQVPTHLWKTLSRKLSCSVMDKIFKHNSRHNNFSFKTESSESFFRTRNSDTHHETMSMENSVYVLHLSKLEMVTEHEPQEEIAAKIRHTLTLIKACSRLNIIPQWSTSFVENYLGSASCFYVSLTVVDQAFQALGGGSHRQHSSDCDLFFFGGFKNTTAASNGEIPVDPRECCVSYILIHAWEDTYSVGTEMGREAAEGEMGFLPVFSAVRYGRPSAVSSLLQHGFAPRFGVTRTLYPCEGECYLNLIFWAYQDALDSIQESAELSEPIKMLYTILMWIHEILEKNSLLMESIGDISLAPAIVHRIRESACILWRDVPYPFVTPWDLYHSISTPEDYLAYRFPDENELCDLYYAFFPNMARASDAPRSLKHHCRCLLRGTFRRKRMLPDAIWQFGFPDTICRFLNLELD